MATINSMDFTQLRLRLAIRKTMLVQKNRRIYRNMLHYRYSWAPRELVEAAIDDFIREGVITELKGKFGKSILTWNEEGVR